MNTRNYNLNVDKEDIDCVISKLLKCDKVEIRDILRRNHLIQVKAETLDKISMIQEILSIDIDKNFYIKLIPFI